MSGQICVDKLWRHWFPQTDAPSCLSPRSHTVPPLCREPLLCLTAPSSSALPLPLALHASLLLVLLLPFVFLVFSPLSPAHVFLPSLPGLVLPPDHFVVLQWLGVRMDYSVINKKQILAMTRNRARGSHSTHSVSAGLGLHTVGQWGRGATSTEPTDPLWGSWRPLSGYRTSAAQKNPAWIVRSHSSLLTPACLLLSIKGRRTLPR